MSELAAELQGIAESLADDVDFPEMAVIIRSTTAADEFGGVTATETESAEYPALLEYLSRTALNTRAVQGQEYVDAVVTMPAMYQGEAVAVAHNDKIKVLEREGNNPERVFQVKRVNPNFGVLFQIEVVTE